MNLSEELTSTNFIQNNTPSTTTSKNSNNKSESLKIFSELKETLNDHAILCNETDLALKELLSKDIFLSDLPSDVAPDEVLALIAVAKGVGLTIYVERDTLPKLKVIIPKIPSAITVYDLKQSFRYAYELEQKRKYQNEIASIKISANSTTKNSKSKKSFSISNSPPCVVQPPPPTKINWRYIWKTYVLTYDLKPLLNDNQSLSSYGIVNNKSRLRFVKRVKIAKQQNKKRI